MSDVTCRLPDGSIKSFPDSMSEKEIKRFVEKKFPLRETAYWLSGPLSRHIEQEQYGGESPSLGARFDYVSPVIARQQDVATPYVDGTWANRGTDLRAPRVAMGSMPEENNSKEDRKLIGGEEWKREPTIKRVIEDVINGVPGGAYGTIPHDIFVDYRPDFFPKYALVDPIRANAPGQYLSGIVYPRRGFYPVVGEPTYSGEKYSGGNGGEDWGLDAPSEHLGHARRNFDAGIDHTLTRSIGASGAGRVAALALPLANPADSVAAYARLIGAILGGRSSARAFGASQNGQTVSNGQTAANVALTRMIRQMQKAGASADEIRQMISENRRRAAGAQR